MAGLAHIRGCRSQTATLLLREQTMAPELPQQAEWEPLLPLSRGSVWSRGRPLRDGSGKRGGGQRMPQPPISSSSASRIRRHHSIFFSFSHFPFALLSLLGPNRTAAPAVQAAERGPAHHPVRCTARLGRQSFPTRYLFPQVRVALGRLTPRPVPVSEANLTHEFFRGFLRQAVEGGRGPFCF